MAPATTPTATSNDNSSNKDFDDTKSGSSNINFDDTKSGSSNTTNAGSKNIACEVCGKTFKNESAVKHLSCVMGLNVNDEFLHLASDFLNCRIGSIPFKYLGLPVGANPRKLSTWEPMLEVVKGRLGSWGNKYVSLGGRIVLINDVLSAIPVFYLSFLKMPVKVWKELVKIQRNFLWGGLSKRRKVCWVKWEEVCKPKKQGGLGVRDLRLVNLSLLAKWRWKLLSLDYAGWKEILTAKYGRGILANRNIGAEDVTRVASSWWRDLCRIDLNSGWFGEAVGKKVGNGTLTSFWNDIWVGGQTLRHRFPRLFGISTQKTVMISEMGVWFENQWRWELSWRRGLFVWEADIQIEFFDVINQFVPTDQQDQWQWLGVSDEGFTVHATYLMLVAKFNTISERSSIQEMVFKNLWRCAAPSKVCAFSWQLLLDRIQTKDNLCKRRIIQVQDTACALCGGQVESVKHLFLHCRLTATVWYQVMSWLGLVVILPPNLFMSFGSLVGCASGKCQKQGLTLIWNAFMWVIWKVRNDRIFNNGVVVIEEMVDRIKLLSWQWFIGRAAKSPCLLYEWRWSPFDCFGS